MYDHPFDSLSQRLRHLLKGSWRSHTRQQRAELSEPELTALSHQIGLNDVLQPADMLDMLERESLKPYFHYRHFTKSKKDGTPRQIVEPDPRLKTIQHAIAQRLLANQPIHPAAVGFQRRKSTADHVWPHVGARTIISADIADFFPSTSRYRVHEWWRKRFPDSEKTVALMLTLLTTYQDALPQGAPTSPPLSNLVNFDMDRQLASLTERSGGTYTRYCDDLLFSWHAHATPPSDFAVSVRAILRGHGYALHPRKGWQIYDEQDEPQVVGVVLTRDGRVRLPPDLRERMRRLARSQHPRDAARLNGYEGYRRMMERR
ncbi:MAG: reverse transcriptase family protein [Anaerolineae bacterium]|nr:reverse transcriptase family protein [Anaerolineae bacterium]MDW8173412.1 reverse transcriptase family protein [Anaerolineae bacterium]